MGATDVGHCFNSVLRFHRKHAKTNESRLENQSAANLREVVPQKE